MRDTPPIIHRLQKKRAQNFQEGTVLSYTVLAHPPKTFKGQRTIGLIELEDGTRVLAPLLTRHPAIGMHVHPRMRLSYVTNEKLRVYEVAYESPVDVPASVPEGSAILTRGFPGYILALTGPSGVGKSTVSLLLLQTFSEYIAQVPILTTRAPKESDEDEYVYVSKAEFDALHAEGKLAAATQIPSLTEDRWYGYRTSDIEAIWSAGKLPVVITEMHLLEQVANHYGRRSILSFGLLPPGNSKRKMLSALLHRLRQRGRDTEEAMQERLKNAEADLAFFHKRRDLFDHLLVNEDLESLMDVFRKNVPGLSEA
jgi:guanylate kinase